MIYIYNVTYDIYITDINLQNVFFKFLLMIQIKKLKKMPTFFVI